MENFDSFGLPPQILQSLEALEFKTPTPIQAQAIPIALQGLDILGSANTGTGKTGAFGIPLVSHLINNPKDIALVITPTRELAVQVIDMIRSLMGPTSDIRTALLIGGQDIRRQLTNLRAEPRLIVGTPGRINDHLQRRKIDVDNIRFLVMDETDRMLDMGFGIQIDRILSKLPKKRQTLLFSATLPDNIEKLTAKYLIDPQRISVGSVSEPTKNVKQETIHITENERYGELVRQLEKREGSIIVFVKTKGSADDIAKDLRQQDQMAVAIHGDLRHSQRARVIQAFRNRERRILVATDIAARGLDISHIEHVINYDLPHAPEDYIHRIGRTGRADAMGEAVNLVTPQDRRRWRAICMLIDPENAEAMKAPRTREKRSSRNRSDAPSRVRGSKARFDNSEMFEKSDRLDKRDRAERPERADRTERPERTERFNKPVNKKYDPDHDRHFTEDNGFFFEDKKSESKGHESKSFGRDRKSDDSKRFSGERKFGDKKFGAKRDFGDRRPEAKEFDGKKFDNRKFDDRKPRNSDSEEPRRTRESFGNEPSVRVGPRPKKYGGTKPMKSRGDKSRDKGGRDHTQERFMKGAKAASASRSRNNGEGRGRGSETSSDNFTLKRVSRR